MNTYDMPCNLKLSWHRRHMPWGGSKHSRWNYVREQEFRLQDTEELKVKGSAGQLYENRRRLLVPCLASKLRPTPGKLFWQGAGHVSARSASLCQEAHRDVPNSSCHIRA